MFARTQRLLLRPGFPEDAPQLARTIADAQIVRNLAKVPWPYELDDAKSHLDRMANASLPHCLVYERTDGAPDLVGACGLHELPSGGVEMGYWIARKAWGRGIATEAGRALLDMARMLRIETVHAGHFVDNPASGRVLEKLGFRPTGLTVPRYSCGRGREVDTHMMALDLGDADVVPIAA